MWGLTGWSLMLCIVPDSANKEKCLEKDYSSIFEMLILMPSWVSYWRNTTGKARDINLGVISE